jgi:hypothetical protein
MLKRWFLKRALRDVLNDKRLAGDLDPRLAGMANDDAALDRCCRRLPSSPSWWESFRDWIVENWDVILAILLQLLLEKEDNA